MGYRIIRADPELERLIDESVDLRIRVSLHDEGSERDAMLHQLAELQARIAKRQSQARNAYFDPLRACRDPALEATEADIKRGQGSGVISATEQ